jgi:hypothetical protein
LSANGSEKNHRKKPGNGGGITDHIWTVEELLSPRFDSVEIRHCICFGIIYFPNTESSKAQMLSHLAPARFWGVGIVLTTCAIRFTNSQLNEGNSPERQIFAELEREAESRLIAAGILDVTVHITRAVSGHDIRLIGTPGAVQRAKEVLGISPKA